MKREYSHPDRPGCQVIVGRSYFSGYRELARRSRPVLRPPAHRDEFSSESTSSGTWTVEAGSQPGLSRYTIPTNGAFL